MQVSCPSCSTAYEIPPPERPRRLRCARCGTEWRAQPPEAAVDPMIAPSAEPDVAPPPPPIAEAANTALPTGEPDTETTPPLPPVTAGPSRAPVSTRQGNAGLWWMLAWLASLALIGAAGFVVWHARVWIAHEWPSSLRLFRLLPRGAPV